MDFKKYGHNTDAQTIEKFRLDAFKELNVEENSETNHVFQRAWSYGHGGGYEEVFEHFRDLVGILRENEESF